MKPVIERRSESDKENYCANCIKPFIEGSSKDVKMCNLILPPTESKSGAISILQSIEQIFQTSINRSGTLNMCLSCTSTLSSLYKLYKKFTDTTVPNSILYDIIKDSGLKRKSAFRHDVNLKTKRLSRSSHNTACDEGMSDASYGDNAFLDDEDKTYNPNPRTTIAPNITLDKSLTYRQRLELQMKKEEDDKTLTYKKMLQKTKQRDHLPTVCTYTPPHPTDTNHASKVNTMKRGSRICPFCNFKFRSMMELHDHLLNVAKIEAYRCPYPDCNETFAWILFYAKHLAKVHSELIYVRGCEKCPSTFYTNYELVNHEANHEETVEPDLDAFEVSDTGSPKKRKKGSKKVGTSKARAFRCSSEDCEKIFTEKIYLKRHVENVHEPPVMFKCDYCPWVFQKESMLAEHSTLHTGEMLFHCEQCDAKLNNKKSLENHIFHFHKKRTEEYFLKTFNIDPLETSTSVGKKHKCDQCTKSYDKRAYLAHHIRVVHEGLNGFSCTICNKYFGSDEARIKHENTATHTEYSCEECSKKFYVKVKYIEHTESHFPIVNIEEKIPEHICELCGKMYITLQRLMRHTEKHDEKALNDLFLEEENN